MRCKTCNYPLWDLPGRQCPECGTPFAPSQYVFARGAVAFKCPHCAQGYAGTSQRGHLEPAQFQCVRCERSISMDETVLVPAAGVAEILTVPRRVPWIEPQPETKGWFSRWRRTALIAVFNPGRLGRTLWRHGPSNARAASFAAVGWGLSIAAAIVFMLVLTLPGQLMFGASLSSLVAGVVGAFSSAAMFVGPALIATLVLALVAHGLLRVTGPLPLTATARVGSADGLRRTFAVFCFLSPLSVFLIVPVVGWPVYFLCYMICGTPMLQSAQRVSAWRATLAITVLPVLAAIGFAVYLAVAMWGAWTGPAWTTYTPPPPPPANVNTWLNVRQQAPALATALQKYAADNGAFPLHPAQLLSADCVSAWQLVVDPADTPTLTLDMASVSGLSPETLAEESALAASRIPPNTVAFRFGDFVFTHYGMTVPPQSQELWLVVYSPNPSGIADPSVSSALFAVSADGRTHPIPVPRWELALEQQNTARAVAGLPPLPDIRSIEHDQPAAAAPTNANEPNGEEPAEEPDP